jgi:hypothetical protein
VQPDLEQFSHPITCDPALKPTLKPRTALAFSSSYASRARVTESISLPCLTSQAATMEGRASFPAHLYLLINVDVVHDLPIASVGPCNPNREIVLGHCVHVSGQHH